MAIVDKMTAHKMMIGSWDMKCKKEQPEFLINQKMAVLAVSVSHGSWDIDYPKIQPFLTKSAILG